MNSTDGSSNVTRLTDTDAYYSNLDWGTTATSSPSGGDGGGPTTPSPEQAIEEAISAIQNLDSVPQSLKTNLIALLSQVLDSLNDDLPTNRTATEEEGGAPMTPGIFN